MFSETHIATGNFAVATEGNHNRLAPASLSELSVTELSVTPKIDENPSLLLTASQKSEKNMLWPHLVVHTVNPSLIWVKKDDPRTTDAHEELLMRNCLSQAWKTGVTSKRDLGGETSVVVRYQVKQR